LSRAVTVIVEVIVPPLAVMLVGARAIVDKVGETPPEMMLNGFEVAPVTGPLGNAGVEAVSV
jgi:hypothetical protein